MSKVKKKFKKIWSDPVWSKVIAGSILGLIGLYFIPPIRRFIEISFLFFIDKLTYEISLPIWSIFLISVSGLMIVILYFWLINFLRPFNTEPDFNSYTRDKIFGITWTWQWSDSLLLEHSLVALCPNCSYELEYQIARDSSNPPFFREILCMHCDHCNYNQNFELTIDQLRNRIIKEILRIVRTNEYKNRLTSNSS